MNQILKIAATIALFCAPLLAGTHTGSGATKGLACHDAYDDIERMVGQANIGECSCELVNKWECTVRYSESENTTSIMSYAEEKTEKRACKAAYDKYMNLMRNYQYDFDEKTVTEGSCDCESTKGGFECIQYFTKEKKSK